MSEKVLFFDTETVTGWVDGLVVTEVVELGWVLTEDGSVIEEGEALTKSIIPIDRFTEGLIEISNSMIADAPDIVEPAKKMILAAENAIVIGHNVAYDFRVLHEALARRGEHVKEPWYEKFTSLPSLDTMWLFRRVMPNAPNKKLKTAMSYAGLDPELKKHRALPDSQYTKAVFFWMWPMLQNMYKVSSVLDLYRVIHGEKPTHGQMSLI